MLRLYPTLLLGLPVLLVAGCLPGGGTPPDPEVAAFLPSALAIDIEELPEDADDDTFQAAQQTRNRYQRVTRAAASVVHRFQRVADRALALGAAISADLESGEQTQLAATLRIQGNEVPYKVDFAPFDIDGDGAEEGSGNPVDVPVALRIWVDSGSGYQQFL